MQASARLWVVSELYYPEQTSTGYFLTKIAEGLASHCRVHVICGRPTYSERGQAVSRTEVRHGVTIHRMRATHFDKDRLALRAINAFTLSLSVFYFSLRHFRKGDGVLAVTNPPTLPPLIGLVSKLRGMRSILLVHDVYPEVLIATNFIAAGSMLHRLLGRSFAATYRLFSDVVVLGRDMRDLVARKLGEGHNAIHIIPNWGDVDEVIPLRREDNKFAIDHDLVGKTIIQFSGNIGRTHDIELILDVARAVADLDDLIFLFVGYGGKTELLQTQLKNVLFLPRQPRELLGPMLACATATIISFVDRMYGVSVPSRMYNVMSAGVPIIAVADHRSELSQTVRESGSGWLIPQGDRPALERLIREIHSPGGRREAQKRGESGRATALSRFTLGQVLSAYGNLFGLRSGPRA